MEEAFQEERFPGIHLREKLARELNIREDRIQVGLTIHLGLRRDSPRTENPAINYLS